MNKSRISENKSLLGVDRRGRARMGAAWSGKARRERAAFHALPAPAISLIGG